MNWEAIGAIAELIAVLAVLPTLFYLAVQLRQNTQAVRSQTIDSLVSAMTASVQSIVESETLADLIARSQDDSTSLSKAERIRYSYALMMVVRRFEGVCFQRELGFIDVEMIRGFERSVLSLIANDQKWWEQSHPAFSDRFVEYVSSALSHEPHESFLGGLARKVD